MELLSTGLPGRVSYQAVYGALTAFKQEITVNNFRYCSEHNVTFFDVWHKTGFDLFQFALRLGMYIVVSYPQRQN